jgi:hypothetical protein
LNLKFHISHLLLISLSRLYILFLLLVCLCNFIFLKKFLWIYHFLFVRIKNKTGIISKTWYKSVFQIFQAKVHDQHEKETKKKNWVNNMDIVPTSEPIEEDLYNISPHIPYAKVKKVHIPHSLLLLHHKNWICLWFLIIFYS